MPDIDFKKILNQDIILSSNFHPVRVTFDADEIKDLCEARSIEYQEGMERNAVLVQAGTSDVDDGHKIIEYDKIDMSDFKTNPTVLLEHGMMQTPFLIGKSLKEVIVKNGTQSSLQALIVFHGQTQESYQAATLMRSGFLSGLSTTILPKKVRAPTSEEKERGAFYVVESSLLKEITVTSLPLNSRCLTMAMAQSLFSERELSKIKEMNSNNLFIKLTEEDTNMNQDELKALIKSSIAEEIGDLKDLKQSGRKLSKASMDALRKRMNQAVDEFITDLEGEKDEEVEEEKEKEESSFKSVFEALSNSVNAIVSTTK
jgi:hypothetical protein